MREVGRPSWRFAHDIDQSLHVVLYMREALRLEIEDDESCPPQLVGAIPDQCELLAPVATGAAARRWLAWWRSVVALQAPAQLVARPEQTDRRAWAHQLAARRRLVFDPPEWASLADSHELQNAARDLCAPGCRWFDRARAPYLPPACRDVFPWEGVRDGAERAAADHDVLPGEVNGCAQVLLVDGSWWQLVAPGAALCSITAARDPDTIPLVLRKVFSSYLTP